MSGPGAGVRIQPSRPPPLPTSIQNHKTLVLLVQLNVLFVFYLYLFVLWVPSTGFATFLVFFAIYNEYAYIVAYSL